MELIGAIRAETCLGRRATGRPVSRIEAGMMDGRPRHDKLSGMGRLI
jgi:hypothetical protein